MPPSRGSRTENRYGLVLSGGGARGAYEAGVIYYALTKLSPSLRKNPVFSVFCGTSVGSINAAFLASTARDPLFQGAQLKRLWEDIQDNHIYHADFDALLGLIIQCLLMFEGRWSKSGNYFNGILDTTPFVGYLRRVINWSELHRNLNQGLIDAISVNTTHIKSGGMVVFCQTKPNLSLRPTDYALVPCQLQPRHVLASAAIPLVFPQIKINKRYYGDGSLVQSSPISPAISLGANRLLIISPKRPQKIVDHTQPPQIAEQPPVTGEMLGLTLDTIFRERLTEDVKQMQRFNRILDKKPALQSILDLLGLSDTQQNSELQTITPLVITPSADIGLIAAQNFWRLIKTSRSLSPMQRLFSRLIENEPDQSNDLLSYLMFDSHFLREVVQLGYDDAKRHHDQLEDFFSA